MNILLVDDHAVVRQGYASLLTALLPEVVVTEAASGEQALQSVQDEVPSLVILDLGLPGISGLETCRRLRQRLPLLPVLIFSMHDEQALVRQALDAGASGYLTKRCAPDVLVEAVRKVLAGQPFIEQPLAVELACQRASSSANQGRLADMTPREMEVFIMLARGISTREIAQRLCISSKTVSNHMALLKNKLEVSSQAELGTPGHRPGPAAGRRTHALRSLTTSRFNSVDGQVAGHLPTAASRYRPAPSSLRPPGVPPNFTHPRRPANSAARPCRCCLDVPERRRRPSAQVVRPISAAPGSFPARTGKSSLSAQPDSF